LIARTPNIARIFGAFAIAAALTWCIAAAATIPTIVDGRRTLVAVEPLLQTLQLAYVIRGTELNVDCRRYPKPLVERDGMDMADATDLARFLHLSLTKNKNVLVFSSVQLPDASESSPPSPADLDGLRQELLATLNEHRTALGRAPLHFDPIAQQAAQYQSEDMSRAAVMRHEDASGRTPMQRFAAMGGRADWYAENVGWYGLDVTGKRELWSAVSKLDAQMMAEQPPNDGHRETIISQQYGGVGIGVTVGPHGLYLAEDFVGP
jgi:uncharacterized protein YkwD